MAGGRRGRRQLYRRVTRKRILQTDFAGATAAAAAAARGEAGRGADHRTDAYHACELPRLVLLAEILQTFRVLVEHAPLCKDRFHYVAWLHLVQIQVEQLVPEPEPLGRARVEFREGIATRGAQRPRARPLLVLLVEGAYPFLQAWRLWRRLAVGARRAGARVAGWGGSRGLGGRAGARRRCQIRARRTGHLREARVVARSAATVAAVSATVVRAAAAAVAAVVVVVQHLGSEPRQRQGQRAVVAPLPKPPRLARHQVLGPLVHQRRPWPRSVVMLVMPSNRYRTVTIPQKFLYSRGVSESMYLFATSRRRLQGPGPLPSQLPLLVL